MPIDDDTTFSGWDPTLRDRVRRKKDETLSKEAPEYPTVGPFPPGNGPMADAIRAFDWSATSLGPISRWPLSLRNAVSLIVASPTAMVMLWGADGVMIYNDAYVVFAADRHPEQLGSKVRDGWAEVAAFNDHVLKVVLAGGSLSFRDQEMVLTRNGRAEAVWLTLDYSPVFDKSGKPAGVLGIVVETTERVLADRGADAQRKRHQAMLQQMPGFAALLTGPEFIYEFVNDAYVAISERDDFIGRRFKDVFPDIADQGFYEILDRVYATGESVVSRNMPLELHGSGSPQFIDFVVEPVRDGNGVVEGVFIGGYEVTEASRVTQELSRREARLRFLDDLSQATAPLADADAILRTTTRMVGEHLDVSNCAYADMDLDENGFTIRGDWAAPGSTSIVGHYSLADFGKLAVQELSTGRPLIINDNLREIAPEEAATFQAMGISATICMPLVKAGRLSALMAIHTAEPHVWSADELSLIREVTERSWAHVERVGSEAALRESEAKYRRLFDTIDEGFCLIEFVDGPQGPLSDYVHVEANAAAAEQTGLDAVLGRTIRDIAGDEAQAWVDSYGGVLRTGASIRFEREFPPTGRWLELAAFRVEPPERRQVAVLFKDLTERRTAELALRASEAQFRAFAEAVPNHVWASRPDGDLYWFNSQVYAYAGLAEGDLDGVAGWGKIVHPDDLPAAAAAWQRALASGETYTTEFRLRRADGAWRWFYARAEPVRHDAGLVTGWIGANSEIHELRTQGEELERVNDILSELLAGSQAERDRLWELSPDLLAVVTYDGRLVRVNPSWTRVLGWDEATLLSRPYVDLLHPDEIGPIAGVLDRMQADGKSVLLEDRLKAVDGQWRSFVWTLSPEPGGERLYGVGRDVTEERAQSEKLALAQESLRQSQKMEAVGQLTGGIAHDFNNLLAGISGALELLGKRLAEGRLNGMERYIDAAQGSAQRAAALTQRLLAFSRRQTLDPKPTDVNRLIHGMDDLIRRSIGPDVELEVVGAGGLWVTRIDSSQLENALLNLCINARDAMAPQGGRLIIETSNKWLDERAAKARDLPPGQYVSLCVTDTGTGMPADVQAQAFDPFFTTKPLGQGTGLGLSMIHGFVRQSGGQVRIYSELGKGTTMCLYLPRFQGSLEVDASDDIVAEIASGGHGETVLIIDDEETVRMLVAEVLGEAGYQVIEAPDGPSGLEILTSDRRIDLLISDVGLPGGMNGRQVADAARISRPDLKVLFITGYAENAAVGNGLLAPGMAILTKPFVMGELAARVHDLIDR